MTTTYTTKAGDTVDYICWKYYGATNTGQIEAVLNANPGVAELGSELPAGIVLTLPTVTTKPATTTHLFG